MKQLHLFICSEINVTFSSISVQSTWIPSSSNCRTMTSGQEIQRASDSIFFDHVHVISSLLLLLLLL